MMRNWNQKEIKIENWMSPSYTVGGAHKGSACSPT